MPDRHRQRHVSAAGGEGRRQRASGKTASGEERAMLAIPFPAIDPVAFAVGPIAVR